MNSTDPMTPRALASEFPHWLRDVDAHLPVAAQFVVHGNIRDRHLVPVDHSFRFLETTPALAALLELSNYAAVITYDPVSGLGLQPDTPESRSALTHLDRGQQWIERLGRPLSLEALSELITAVQPAQPQARVALVIDYVSQFSPAGAPISEGLHEVFRTSLHRMHRTRQTYAADLDRTSLYNPVFWIVDRPSDLPGWLVGATDGSHTVPIPLPDLDARDRAARQLAAGLSQRGMGDFTDDQRREFVSQTDGMTLRAMFEIIQLANDQRLSTAELESAIRMYRVGLIENPWNQAALKQNIRDAGGFMSSRVLGQPGAIRRSLDILMRSTTGLTSAHTGGRSTGPRGVLFLAGPTGVGKTELAKTLTEVIFGNPNAYIRFDMSEFSNTGSDLRLMGAPPGYIGHEAGGELTNAVRQKPFSLVLFDEIEKAHPPIMDKFLQILSDGRLTDGSGATVHFSETIIVFTSNKGMADPLPAGGLPTAALPFTELDAHVRQAVSRHFTEELGRPELLNRLGDNIVVFDFIRSEVATELLTNFVANTLARVHELHAIEVTLTDTAHETLWRECCSDLSMGGRGIGQRVESVLTNPLARAVFLHDDSHGPIHIRNFVREEGGAWALDIG